jgi:hypothetical protein
LLLLNAQFERLRNLSGFECGLQPILKPEKLPIPPLAELRSA